MQENSFVVTQENIKKLNLQQNFVDHNWLNDGKIVIASDKGEVNIIKDNEVVQ